MSAPTRVLVACALLVAAACGSPPPSPEQITAARARLEKRWLFVWRDMRDPSETDRMIARFPQAAADGYNGVAFASNIPPDRAPALKTAAAASHLDLIAIVMGNPRDRNDVEGVRSEDARFVVRGDRAVLEPDRPVVVNAGFERARGDRISDWTLQDAPGQTTFADHDVTHSGRTSLRIENVGRSGLRNSRVMQTIALRPHRQYRVSFWVKTDRLAVAEPEVKVLGLDNRTFINFQTFHAAPTQDWTHYDLVFNSFEHSRANLFLGYWQSQNGTVWFDDVEVEEIGLVNVLRRPGCPVTVTGEDGTVYTEGVDFEPIVDAAFNPWQPYHASPAIHLKPGTRIADGERLRVSYYHPIVVYEDRLTTCLSEERVFEDWRAEVVEANELFQPAAFIMSHDELRVVNQCALCRSRHLTPGQLLASNVRRAAQIIRDVRKDAGIWVWSDMFDPAHNAVDHFFAVNGSLAGSWEGLDPDVGILNWHPVDRSAPFFAARGLKQILAGYYDGDDDGARITTWLKATAPTPGIVGAMYTTWLDRYSAMDAWAAAAWGPQPPAGGR